VFHQRFKTVNYRAEVNGMIRGTEGGQASQNKPNRENGFAQDYSAKPDAGMMFFVHDRTVFLRSIMASQQPIV
jgi:hypothetical protein